MLIYGSQKIKHSVEKDVLAVLESVKTKDLEDRLAFGIASVSFSPKRWRDCEIDFLLVGTAGVYVLEVKGGKISLKEGIWYSEDHNGQSYRIDPFGQSQSHFYELWKFMQDIGINLDRNPLGHFGCIFPEYKFTELPDLAWSREQYLDSDFMKSPTEFLNKLLDDKERRYGKNRTLDSNQLKKIKEFLVPDYENYIRDISYSVDEKVLLLSEEQNIVFDALANVKRMVIDGPPGSGKTILAEEQLIANEKAGIKTLYVCFNRAIRNKVAYDIKSKVKSEPKFVNVLTTTMLRDDSGKYEYLILDESQDYLNDSELADLDKRVKGGFEKGRFRIFIDQNQDTFHKSEVKALNKLINRDDVLLYPLKHNYRNSAKIIEYVRKMTPLRIGDIRNNPEGLDPEICKIPYSGNSVDYNNYPAAVCAKINELLDSGIRPSDIMVVSMSGSHASALSERNMQNLSLNNKVTLSAGRDIDWSKFLTSNTIINGNSYDLKGLDSKVVVCTDVFSKADKEEALLVGMTRARSRLIVFQGNNFK